MINNNIASTPIVFFLLLLVSCNKSNLNIDTLNSNNTEIDSNAELLKIYTFTNTPVEGTFAYSSTSTFASQNFTRDDFFGGRFHSSAAMGNFGVVQTGNLVKLGNEVLIPDGTNSYHKDYLITDKIWGKTTNISLQETPGLPIVKTSFRVPKLIEVENYNPQVWRSKLSENGTIKIKLDTGNAKGVLVTLEYQPTYNDSLRLAGYKKVIRNAEVQNDDGVIELSGRLFENIPAKCSYQLTIGRVNYQIVEAANEKKYGLYAYLSVSNFYIND